MANILRCDKCKGLSDGENPTVGIGDCHYIEFKLDKGQRYSMEKIKLSHPLIHLCYNCMKEVVATGHFTNKLNTEDF